MRHNELLPWPLVPLGQIADFIMGQAPPSIETNDEGRGTPFVKAGEFDIERPIIREWTTRPLKLAQHSDVLICVVGATCGKLNLGIDCAIGRSVAAIRPSQQLDQRFLLYYLTTRVFDLRGQSSGSAQGVISKQLLSDLLIPFPPLSVQRRIVRYIQHALECIDVGQSELQRAIVLTERYQRASIDRAYDAAMSEEVDGTIATQTLGNLLLSLDQGWSPKCSAESTSDPGRWAVMTTTAVQPLSFNSLENKVLPSHLSPKPKLEVDTGDILVTRAGPRKRVGVACVVNETKPRLMVCDKVYRLRVNEGVTSPQYIAIMLNATPSLDRIENMKSGTDDSGLNLTQSKLLNLPIPVPARATQDAIVERIKRGDYQRESIGKDVARATSLLRHLKDSVLLKAMEGSLSFIADDRSDEDHVAEARSCRQTGSVRSGV